MADVKIVDIDNEQWNMKDQEARNRIANLESVLQTKANEIKAEIIGTRTIDIIQTSGFFDVQVTVPDGYKCLFTVVQWNHPARLSMTVSSQFNFKGSTPIYVNYYARDTSSNEIVSVIGLLIKEN